MSQLIGIVNEFDYKSQDWQIFHKKLTNFLKLNKIDTENWNSVLIAHLSDESYRLVRNLVHPKEVETVPWTELVRVLNGHFQPKRSTFADRAKFYDAIRMDGEKVEDWAARLRGLAVHCDFGTELDTLLRDRFILGLKVGPERDRLFEQDSKSLTLSRAIEIAQETACARAARACVGDGGEQLIKQEMVYRVGERRGQDVSRPGPAHAAAPSAARCAVCGLKGHSVEKCRFKDYKCMICGEKGHLKKVCSVKKVGKVSLHNLDASSSDGHVCKECDLYNLRYVHYDPIKVNITIDNKLYSMELDCGAGRSVISESFYKENFQSYRLLKSDVVFCLYTKHKVTPLGYFDCKVCYNGIKKQISFYVITQGGPPLLGRDFMAQYNMSLVSMSSNNSLSVRTECQEVQKILNEFPDIWRDELGRFNKCEVHLHLKENAVPKFFKPRQIPFALKDKVMEELDRLVRVGILIPVQFSDFATPIVPVLKENGKVKIAGDFSCTLNKVLKIDKYPLPHIDEVFAKLGGGEHYSKLDLSNAYNQLCLSESSQDLTTINTPKGLFKYTRLVYGLANAPAIFQRAIESLVAGIEGVSCWYDDICLTAPNRTLHLERLRMLLCRIQDAGLRLQKEKCSFFQDSVTYLGFKIDKNGLKTCPSKVEAILRAPVPTNVLELKRFLGVINYYRNFIPNASSMLSPLNELLKDNIEWHWDKEQQSAFDSVRRELASDRVLAHFDPRARLVLTVDAGPTGLGAVLAHLFSDGTERPIAFGSRSLSPAEKNYSQIMKEACALVFGIKRFHQYLYGCQEPFVLRTDHRPLLSIFGKKDGISVTTALRLQRYAIMLSAYNYEVQYISNKNNIVADYFSRAPLSIESSGSADRKECDDLPIALLFMNATQEPVSFERIQRATADDKIIKTVINYMQQGWPRKISCRQILPFFMCKTDLQVIGGCVFRGHRIVIPSIFRERMLEELHNAHFGIVKTKSAARSRMWWPGIDGDIERMVGSCGVCAAQRSAPPRAPPSPWPRPPAPWHRIHIDYMSIGQTVYLIVIDAFSKWLECIHMNYGTSTSALILKLKQLYSVFGIPNEIVSDNDIKICSTEFQQFCKNNGINYLNSPIYHPASNGQAENSVRTCKKMLKCIIEQNNNNSFNPRIVQDKLFGYLFEYRNNIHCTTGATPSSLMFGRNVRTRLDIVLPTSHVNSNLEIENKELCKSRKFKIGEVVWARWFTARKASWMKGIITNIIGNRMFHIKFKNCSSSCIRHLDQIIKCTDITSTDDIVSDVDFAESASSSVPDQLASAAQSTSQPNSESAPSSPAHTAAGPAPAPLPTDSLQPPLSDNVRGEGEDGDEWEEASHEVTAVPAGQPTECNKPDSPHVVSTDTDNVIAEGATTSDRRFGRSMRPRKAIDFKKYF